MSGSVHEGSSRRRGKGGGAGQPKNDEQVEQGDQAPSAAMMAEAVGKEILRQVDRRPYLTLVAAATTGYIVAVATPNWAIKLAWTVGGRVAMARMVANLT